MIYCVYNMHAYFTKFSAGNSIEKIYIGKQIFFDIKENFFLDLKINTSYILFVFHKKVILQHVI